MAFRSVGRERDNVGELRRGVGIELDGKIFSVVEYQHIKMGRGGAQVRLKLRDLRSGAIFDRTFPASEKFARIRVERRPVQFTYSDGGVYYFMDQETLRGAQRPPRDPGQTPWTTSRTGWSWSWPTTARSRSASSCP